MTEREHCEAVAREVLNPWWIFAALLGRVLAWLSGIFGGQ